MCLNYQPLFFHSTCNMPFFVLKHGILHILVTTSILRIAVVNMTWIVLRVNFYKPVRYYFGNREIRSNICGYYFLLELERNKRQVNRYQ